MSELSREHQRFVEEYLIDLNATRAYMAVYPDSSYEAAMANASRLIGNDKVQAVLTEAMQSRSERTQITADAVVKELAILGFADLADYVKWGPSGIELKDSETLDKAKRRAIIEVSQTQHGVKIKLADKKGSLDSLGRHLGIFEADNKQQSKREITLKKADEYSDDELAAIAGLAPDSGS